MIGAIEEHRPEIEALCRDHRVRRLEVFGSAARGRTAGRVGDIDLLVEFEPMPPGAYVDAYFGLLEGLEALFGRHVDLVSARSIRNPYFRESIDRDRVLLYAA